MLQNLKYLSASNLSLCPEALVTRIPQLTRLEHLNMNKVTTSQINLKPLIGMSFRAFITSKGHSFGAQGLGSLIFYTVSVTQECFTVSIAALAAVSYCLFLPENIIVYVVDFRTSSS